MSQGIFRAAEQLEEWARSSYDAAAALGISQERIERIRRYLYMYDDLEALKHVSYTCDATTFSWGHTGLMLLASEEVTDPRIMMLEIPSPAKEG